jgi:hypothetical protein
MSESGLKRLMWIAVVIVATATSTARAQSVGGHVGVAFPFATFSRHTTTIADSVVIANPIGIGIGLTESLKVDFETVVLTTWSPVAKTDVLIDPGVIYSWEHVAIGLRIAFRVGASANIGCIPLVNVPLIKMPKATWFVEAAFPTFYSDHTGSFTTVLHTGVGF